MASNRLRLNPTKTEFIWLGTARRRQQLANDKVSLSGVCLQPSERVRDLGVEVDCDLSMAAHVGHHYSLCFFHLRQLRLLWRSLTTDAAQSIVRALIRIVD